MQIIFATTNKYKFDEISKILLEFGIVAKRKSFNLHEINSDNLEKISMWKAMQVYKIIKKPLIVEDTGIYFSAYKNFPGTKPKRVFEVLGYKGLLGMLKGKKRAGYFKTVICYFDGKKAKTFVGKLDGRFSKRPTTKKAYVMPYEKIFIPAGKNKLLARFSRHEKNKFSHRAIATRKFARWFCAVC